MSVIALETGRFEFEIHGLRAVKFLLQFGGVPSATIVPSLMIITRSHVACTSEECVLKEQLFSPDELFDEVSDFDDLIWIETLVGSSRISTSGS